MRSTPAHQARGPAAKRGWQPRARWGYGQWGAVVVYKLNPLVQAGVDEAAAPEAQRLRQQHLIACQGHDIVGVLKCAHEITVPREIQKSRRLAVYLQGIQRKVTRVLV